MDNNMVKNAVEAGRIIGSQSVTYIGGVPLVIVPDGYKAELHKELLVAPTHVEKSVTTDTTRSFIVYFNAFADDNSAIFCNAEMAEFVGIIDYHSTSAPAWGRHKVTFSCKPTREWTSWRNSSGTKMDQTRFAHFVEDNLDEIIDPPGAQMLEIATTLKAKTQISFTSAKRLNDGQTQFQYVEDHEGGAGIKGEIKIPETFKLGVRIFEGGEAYQLEARFRYRIKERQATLWYDLVRPHKAHRAAVDDALEKIKQQTKCQLIIQGKP